jgi:hypothetical protein
MSAFGVIFSSIGFDFDAVFSSPNNENNTNTGTTKTLDQIIGNIATNGNQSGYQSFKNDVYYQIKTGSILNPISISNAGDRINNIVYDNDQKSIIIVLTPSQNKSGIVEVNLPRNIIDSKIDKRDKNFTVLVNNQPAKYQEIIEKNNSNILSPGIGSNTSSGGYTLDNDSRKLVIEFGKDARIIKIIGTELDNISSQNQSGLDISKSNDIQDSDQNSLFLVPIISFIVGIILVAVYFMYRKRKVKLRK